MFVYMMHSSVLNLLVLRRASANYVTFLVLAWKSSIVSCVQNVFYTTGVFDVEHFFSLNTTMAVVARVIIGHCKLHRAGDRPTSAMSSVYYRASAY